MTTIEDCKIIELPKIYRAEGNITPVEGGRTIPFDIARVFYLYDVPGGESRGAHAHRELEQLLISVMGAFEVILDDGRNQKKVRLERAYYGLYIPGMIWGKEVNFSSGGVCLVLASRLYDEADYIRDYSIFVNEKGGLDLP